MIPPPPPLKKKVYEGPYISDFGILSEWPKFSDTHVYAHIFSPLCFHILLHNAGFS